METRTDEDTPTLYPIQLHERLLAIHGGLSAKRRLAFKNKIIFDAEILLLQNPEIQRYRTLQEVTTVLMFLCGFLGGFWEGPIIIHTAVQ